MKPIFTIPDIPLWQLRGALDRGYSPRPSCVFANCEREPEAPVQGERSAEAALARENRFVRRMLDDRDRQFAELQAEFAAMRRDWAWRALGVFRLGLRRLQRQFRPAVATARAGGRDPAGRGMT